LSVAITEKSLVNDVAETVGAAAAELVLAALLVLLEVVELELELEPHPATIRALAASASVIAPMGPRLANAIHRNIPAFDISLLLWVCVRQPLHTRGRLVHES
jgi:hypothetical protein